MAFRLEKWGRPVGAPTSRPRLVLPPCPFRCGLQFQFFLCDDLHLYRAILHLLELDPVPLNQRCLNGANHLCRHSLPPEIRFFAHLSQRVSV